MLDQTSRCKSCLILRLRKFVRNKTPAVAPQSLRRGFWSPPHRIDVYVGDSISADLRRTVVDRQRFIVDVGVRQSTSAVGEDQLHTEQKTSTLRALHHPPRYVMGSLHDPANVQCIQNTLANAGRLLDRVNTLLVGASRRTIAARSRPLSEFTQPTNNYYTVNVIHVTSGGSTNLSEV